MNGALYLASIYGAKTALVLLVMVALYRLLGKRDVGSWNLYDLVTVAAVANAVQNAMTGGRGELVIGLASSATLILLGFAIVHLAARNPRFERAVVGSPTLLLYQGQVLGDKMRKERVSMDDLREALRAHGLVRPSQVAMAVLEVDGTITVIPMGAPGCPDISGATPPELG